jgi:hypothetical protein
MKRIAVTLIATSILMTAASVGSAKDLSVTGLEEAFVDALGTCGPSSNVASALGKSDDPQVKIALRNALIAEAADDAARVAGANQPHSDCLRKDLTSRGYTGDELSALPYCVKYDWPDPFTSLGTCVESHSRLEALRNAIQQGAMNRKLPPGNSMNDELNTVGSISKLSDWLMLNLVLMR